MESQWNSPTHILSYSCFPIDDLSFLCHTAGEGARSSSWQSHRWWVKSSTSWRLSLCKSGSLLDICWLHAMQPNSNLTHGFLLLPSMPCTASCLSFLWVSELANDTCTLHTLEIGVENVVIAARAKARGEWEKGKIMLTRFVNNCSLLSILDRFCEPCCQGWGGQWAFAPSPRPYGPVQRRRPPILRPAKHVTGTAIPFLLVIACCQTLKAWHTTLMAWHTTLMQVTKPHSLVPYFEFFFLDVSHRYLTGFTLFLSLILNRTFFMILDLLQTEENMETIRNEVYMMDGRSMHVHTDIWRYFSLCYTISPGC